MFLTGISTVLLGCVKIGSKNEVQQNDYEPFLNSFKVQQEKVEDYSPKPKKDLGGLLISLPDGYYEGSVVTYKCSAEESSKIDYKQYTLKEGDIFEVEGKNYALIPVLCVIDELRITNNHNKSQIINQTDLEVVSPKPN